jgi:hypothetical protein
MKRQNKINETRCDFLKQSGMISAGTVIAASGISR